MATCGQLGGGKQNVRRWTSASKKLPFTCMILGRRLVPDILVIVFGPKPNCVDPRTVGQPHHQSALSLLNEGVVERRIGFLIDLESEEFGTSE